MRLNSVCTVSYITKIVAIKINRLFKAQVYFIFIDFIITYEIIFKGTQPC